MGKPLNQGPIAGDPFMVMELALGSPKDLARCGNGRRAFAGSYKLKAETFL